MLPQRTTTSPPAKGEMSLATEGVGRGFKEVEFHNSPSIVNIHFLYWLI